MLKPRLYLLLLKRGIPGMLFFLFLGMYGIEVHWEYKMVFFLMLCLSVLVAYMVTRCIYKSKTGEKSCIRFHFMLKEPFYQMLRSYGLPIAIVLLVSSGCLILPGESFFKMLVLLVICCVLSYWGTITFFRHFTAKKDWE